MIFNILILIWSLQVSQDTLVLNYIIHFFKHSKVRHAKKWLNLLLAYFIMNTFTLNLTITLLF